MFRGDVRHSGLRPYAGPESPEIKGILETRDSDMRWNKSPLRFPVLQKENRATAPDKGRSRRSPGCSAPTESASNPGVKDGKNGNEPPNGGSGVDYGTFTPGFPLVTLGYVSDARSAGLTADHRRLLHMQGHSTRPSRFSIGTHHFTFVLKDARPASRVTGPSGNSAILLCRRSLEDFCLSTWPPLFVRMRAMHPILRPTPPPCRPPCRPWCRRRAGRPRRSRRRRPAGCPGRSR